MTDKGRSIRADYRVELSKGGERRIWSQELAGTPFERLFREVVFEVDLAPTSFGTEVALETRQKPQGLGALRRRDAAAGGEAPGRRGAGRARRAGGGAAREPARVRVLGLGRARRRAVAARPRGRVPALRAGRRRRGRLAPGGAGGRASAAVGAGGGGLRARLAELAEVRDDAAARVGHCRGKSYLDLLRQRAGDCEDAPDAVVAPGTRRGGPGRALRLQRGGRRGGAVRRRDERRRRARAAARALRRADLARPRRGWRAIESFDERSHLAWLRGGTRLPEADHALAQRGFTLGHTPQSYEWATVGGCVATRSAGQSSTGHGRIEENVVGAALRDAGGRAREPAGAGHRGRAGAEGARDRLRGRARRDHRRRAARVPAAGGAALRGLGVPRASRRAARRCATLAQAELAPDIARLSDEAETRMSFALAGNGAKARRWARCCAGAACSCAAGRATRRRSPSAASSRRARCGAPGAWPLGQAPGQAWAATRYAGPHLRDDLLDRGVMVETLETATTWSNLGGAARGGHARAGGRARRAARALPRVARLRDRRLALLHGLRGPGPRRPGRPVAAGEGARRWTRSWARGGTITHHHAVGADHAPWLGAETGPLGHDLLRVLKERCDPAGVMNPGKLGL